MGQVHDFSQSFFPDHRKASTGPKIARQVNSIFAMSFGSSMVGIILA
jgi:hypothetical protein